MRTFVDPNDNRDFRVYICRVVKHTVVKRCVTTRMGGCCELGGALWWLKSSSPCQLINHPRVCDYYLV